MILDIKSEIAPVLQQICNVTNVEGYIGTGMQDFLESNIRPLLPTTVGYTFYWNMNGHYSHIFYEIENPENILTLGDNEAV